VSNLVNTGIMVLCEATLDDAWLDVDVFSPIMQPGRLSEEFDAFMVQWRKTQSVDPGFKVAVADFQMLLMDLRRWLDQVELGVRSEPVGVRAEMERRVLQELEVRILPEIDEWMSCFDTVAARIGEDLRPAHRAYARRQIHPLVMCSPFVYRTFQKPLGYAGDYEMVNMILRDPHEGATMFSKLVNVVFLQNPPAEAHRNRIKHLRDRLVEETERAVAQGRSLKVLNLGCGPAREIQLFLAEEELANRTDLLLLDFNGETLEYTRRILDELRLRHARRTTITMEEKSINQLLKEALRPEMAARRGYYDLVYCAGLFDYVSDRVCKRLTELFYELLAPGGLLIVTNVSATKPFRHSMDYLLEWHLLYRDVEQMKELLPPGVTPDDWRVLADPTGVNLYLEVRKPATV
jgi:extracellular factor (EF) 3-hydroxypalmitic acid methyl ester biosynthesis protein